jgi:hypothetical protein
MIEYAFHFGNLNMMAKEEIKQEIAQLRELLLRCKAELGNVEPLSDRHGERVDALYAEVAEILDRDD